MNVVNVWRSESDSAILRNGKVRREPLKILRDVVFVIAWRFYDKGTGLWILDEGAVVDDWVEGRVD